MYTYWLRCLLVGKLEVAEAEDTTEEMDGDPVNLLEDEGGYSNTPIHL